MQINRAAAAALAAATVAAPIAAAQGVPTKDAFKAAIDSGTGRLQHAHGKFEIDLARTGAARYRLTLDFRGAGCAHKRRCRPNGKLRGRITPIYRPIPDIGTSYSINASGKLKSLGHVTATGTVNGPGNIAIGYETMVLTLKTNSGTVKLDAKAGPVHGFSSP